MGNERAFLTWFYEGATGRPEVFTDEVVDEHLVTFCGRTGVRCALDTCRTAFDSIDQTAPLRHARVGVPVVALGRAKGLGDQVGTGLSPVVGDVTGGTLSGRGYLSPEEEPDAVVRYVFAMDSRIIFTTGW